MRRKQFDTPSSEGRAPSMKPASRLLRRVAAAATLGASLAAPAWAENHALIMWIGDYGSEKMNLPGIDLDAANAKRIAAAMGVPAGNVTELANAELTKDNVAKSLVGLYQRIKDGDKVFIYYSGHGYQSTGQAGGARCTEALVTREPALFLDSDMQTILTRMGEKASQVVMMNDSCFSGGAATKSLAPVGDDAPVPKFYPANVKANSAVTSGYSCGEATNKMTRNLTGLMKENKGPQVLYVAASTDTQVSFATKRGSLATLAWVQCLTSASSDTNRSGSINGEEMQACAQKWIDSRGAKQTIMLQGNAKLPLSFVQTAAAAPAAVAATTAPATTPAPAPAAAPAPEAAPVAVNAAQALQDLRAGGDRSYQVALTLARSSLRIGKDLLDFSVTTNREGYVYLLQVGSDGKTFNLLFPNKLDDNNFLQAGTHRFPRESWRVRSGGPAGTSHLLAIVSPVKKDLARDMNLSSVFASSAADQRATRTLIVEATGADAGGSGRYGASAVASINETAN